MQRGFWLILGHVLPHGVFVPPHVSELRVGEEVKSQHRRLLLEEGQKDANDTHSTVTMILLKSQLTCDSKYPPSLWDVVLSNF